MVVIKHVPGCKTMMKVLHSSSYIRQDVIRKTRETWKFDYTFNLRLFRKSSTFAATSQQRPRYTNKKSGGKKLKSDAIIIPKRVTHRDVEELASFVNGRIVIDENNLQKYNIDWTSHFVGYSPLVLKPQNTEEVSSILRYCNQRAIGVVPQAGNTGLVGGSIATTSNEVIVSTELLQTIHSFNPIDGTLVCDAGCVLQNLQSYLEQHDFICPLDISSKGSCQIGGNLSTNAGGQYFSRYGSLHSNVLGIEVVVPDGSVLNLMSVHTKKNNMGYDLKHLFIGAEGTLGVITKVVLSCPPKPKSLNVALLGFDSIDKMHEFSRLAKRELGEILAALEFMDRGILRMISSSTKNVMPFDLKGNDDGNPILFTLLLETQGSNETHDTEKLEKLLETCIEDNLVADGVMAQDGKQMEAMWNIRESCSPVTQDIGYTYKYDICLPISKFYTVADEVKSWLKKSAKQDTACPVPVAWGHFMDGNVHLNIVTPGIYRQDPILLNELNEFIFKSVTQKQGSISAEHGIGQEKRHYLGKTLDSSVLDLMFAVKHAIDPKGIMNPSKVLPPTNIS